jgi:regulator of protease activity HflC (stomatin/prohibitin superfamily)
VITRDNGTMEVDAVIYFLIMPYEATAMLAALGGMKDLLDVKSDATR